MNVYCFHLLFCRVSFSEKQASVLKTIIVSRNTFCDRKIFKKNKFQELCFLFEIYSDTDKIRNTFLKRFLF